MEARCGAGVEGWWEGQGAVARDVERDMEEVAAHGCVELRRGNDGEAGGEDTAVDRGDCV